MTHMGRVAAAFALSVMLAGTASAQDVLPLGEEKVKLMLGGFLPAFDTDVRVDGEDMRGDDVSLGDDLGVDEDESGGWIGVEWRFAPRHRLGFTYSRFTRQGERDIDRTLTIGDETYPAGARVSTTSRLEILPITYSYSVLKRPHDELSLTAGLHWSRITLDLRGSVSLGTEDLSNSVSSELDVPLPLIGARAALCFGHRRVLPLYRTLGFVPDPRLGIHQYPDERYHSQVAVLKDTAGLPDVATDIRSLVLDTRARLRAARHEPGARYVATIAAPLAGFPTADAVAGFFKGSPSPGVSP